MTKNASMQLLVGDNPFHGISHLKQERSRQRNCAVRQSEYAAGLVVTALDNGADGFMFSVSDTTLSILEDIRKTGQHFDIKLYAIVPYAYEYVRLATKVGGIPGVAKQMIRQIVGSMNLRAIALGIKGVGTLDLNALVETYVLYELSRIKSAAGKHANLASVMLHEIITEMALAFNLDCFFKSYIEFLITLGIKPGFETRNFAVLVEKFKKWNIDFEKITIASAFNKVGFQMNPSQTSCEKALLDADGADLIAMSILAAGYLKPPEAIQYINTLPNITGIVVGVSKEHHSRDTFKLLRKQFI